MGSNHKAACDGTCRDDYFKEGAGMKKDIAKKADEFLAKYSSLMVLAMYGVSVLIAIVIFILIIAKTI